MGTPIVDSHIHLFPATHLPTLAWYDGPGNPLGSQHSVDEYRTAVSSVPASPEAGTDKYLRGFIFLETDRRSTTAQNDHSTGVASPGWIHALDEVSFLSRIARGEPLEGEGHKPVDKDLCLGIIPWAPVPGGPDCVRRYVEKVQEAAQTEQVFHKIRGFRYLVQDKPAGTMLDRQFVDSLRWLGKQNYTFDLGVDARQGGLHQLREAVEMMSEVYKLLENAEDAVTIVINHLCKPNLRLKAEALPNHPDFLEWKDLIGKMAQASERTYMKLSGAFSELLPLGSGPDVDILELVKAIQPWTDVVFDAFGPSRVMFGSDWPVCNIGGGGNDVSWNRWKQIVEDILQARGLTDEEKQGVWGRVAIKAYGIEIYA